MTEASQPVAKAAPRRRRRGATLVILLGLIAAVWSGLWLLGSRYANAGFDKVLAAESGRGRVWGCADRHIGGYPFGFELTCANPSFAGEISGRKVVGTAAGLMAVAHIYRPTEIMAEVEGPLDLRAPDGSELLKLAWKQLRVNASVRPGSLDDLAIVADGPELQTTSAEFGDIDAKAASARVHLAPAAGQPSASNAVDIALDLTGAAVPPLDEWIGSTEPVDVSAAGMLSQARFAGSGTLADKLEQWRTAGGQLDIVRSSIVKGDSRIDATGSLGLDSDHRPTGHIDANASGLEPVLKQLGLPSGAVALTGLVSSLFGTSPAKAEEGAASGIPLPLTFSNGTVSVGPIKTKFRLRPLY